MSAARLIPGWLRAVLLVLVYLASATQSLAHEVRPGLLDIRETQPGWFEVTWKVPVRTGKIIAITPLLPEGLAPVAPPLVQDVPGARVEKTTYRATDGGTLVGGTITIDGLSAQQIDVLIQVYMADGTTYSAVARPQAPSWQVPVKASGWEVAYSYWIIGIKHILSGVDHLLFVLALIFLIPNFWMLVKAITAFTASHTITLGLATLGFVNMPPGPTEAIIALSILFLAVEIVHQREGKISLTERAPWIVAFLFGLFHGLGFAGALSALGIPEHAIPVALLMFNVGVETGQIMFVITVLAIIAVTKRMRVPWPAWGWRAIPFGIGSMASYWIISRVGAFYI